MSKKEQGLLLSASADGSVTYWDVISGKSLSSIKGLSESDIYSLDLSKSGTQIAIGGKDFNVRVFDFDTKSLRMVLEPGNSIKLGHTNRVYSVKFTDDPHILVSGGYDNTIFIWDLRTSKSIGYIFGPHIRGDSIDVRQDTMLTGGFDKEGILQLWSIGDKKLLRDIIWNPEPHDDSSGYVYTARFEKDHNNRYVVASGRIDIDKNEIRIFANKDEYKLIGRIGLNKTAVSLDFMNTKQCFAVGSGDGFVYSFNYGEKE